VEQKREIPTLIAETSATQICLVRPEGVEPPTYSSVGCRSIQLSYGRKEFPIVNGGSQLPPENGGMLRLSATRYDTLVGKFGSSPKAILVHPENAYIVTELELTR
jgi:hypothetical protein